MKQKSQEDYSDPHLVVEYSDKSELLVGAVYEVLDEKHWGFKSSTRKSWHPGACYGVDSSRGEAKLVKGTSNPPRDRYLAAYAVVLPQSTNGLEKITYFSLRQTYSFKSRKIELLHHNRLIGNLSEDDLKSIQSGLCEFTGRESE